MAESGREPFTNPTPGDNVTEVCVLRQVERGVSRPTAERVCHLMSTVLHANGQDPKTQLVAVPAVFTREGVHNGQYKSWAEIERAAPSLLSTPFFVNQGDEHVAGVSIEKVESLVRDRTRHHGVVVQVTKDAGAKTLRGVVGLYTPDQMKAHGASKERIEFQETFLKALAAGGRFAISPGFYARPEPEVGTFQGKPYSTVERGVIFHSTSLVAKSAEPASLMNGFVGEDMDMTPLLESQAGPELSAGQGSEMPDSAYAVVYEEGGRKVRKLPMNDAQHVLAAAQAILGARGDTDLPSQVRRSAACGVLSRARSLGVRLSLETRDKLARIAAGPRLNSLEPLNTLDPHDSPSPMADDTDWVRAASLEHIQSLSPEVTRIVKERDDLQAKIKDDAAKAAEVAKDRDATRAILAKVISPQSPTEALAAHPMAETIAAKVADQFGQVTTEVNSYRQEKAKTLEARRDKAVKTLANKFTADEVKAFTDPKDLESTVNRLETLARKHAPGIAVPPVESLVNVEALEGEPQAPLSGDDEFLAQEQRSFANLEHYFQSGAKAPPTQAPQKDGGEA